MVQFSVRLSDRHGAAIKSLAQAQGDTIKKALLEPVVGATDPSNAQDESLAVRERLAHAGMSVDHVWGEPVRRPAAVERSQAAAAASRGMRLSAMVAEQRR